MPRPEQVPINILIVDDEPKNLTVLESILDSPAYRLVQATSAEEALLALIADDFALLILDIHMPVTSGLELAQLIKQRTKTAHVPIIFLTAYYTDDPHVAVGYETGAVDYLQKPVSPSVLRSKVAVFAELHRKSAELSLANKALRAEIGERRLIEQKLNDLNRTLEQRVADRTAELRENEARLRHAANVARLTYLELDYMRREIRAAENFCRVIGCDAPVEENMSSSVLLDHVVPSDRARVQHALTEFTNGTTVGRVDYQAIGDDHVERWFESEWFVEVAAGGEPIKGFLTTLDVTDRKLAEEQIRRSEENLRQLADSMPQMVWTARPDGYIDYCNARWYDFTGFGAAGGEFATWAPVLHSEDFEKADDSWKRSVKTGTDYRIQCRLWDRHAKRYRWHLARALPVRQPGGAIVKWIGTLTDIDEQKRIEDSLRQANHSLEQFAYAASHDLQEPLRNVAIYTQLLQQNYGSRLCDEEAAKILGTIVEGAQRMGRLVSDLLEYTKAAGSNEAPAPAIVDAEEVFEQVLRNLFEAAREAAATITRGGLPRVAIERIHLEQLLQNLISNAIKYRKDDEPLEIHVSALMESDECHFVVQDNGIGIAPQYQQDIFGVFKRLHVDRARYKGNGIGLAICQKIIDRYGGRIWVASELGKGAAFHFTIPC